MVALVLTSGYIIIITLNNYNDMSVQKDHIPLQNMSDDLYNYYIACSARVYAVMYIIIIIIMAA